MQVFLEGYYIRVYSQYTYHTEGLLHGLPQKPCQARSAYIFTTEFGKYLGIIIR
jgi:hypothetical protein